MKTDADKYTLGDTISAFASIDMKRNNPSSGQDELAAYQEIEIGDLKLAHKHINVVVPEEPLDTLLPSPSKTPEIREYLFNEKGTFDQYVGCKLAMIFICFLAVIIVAQILLWIKFECENYWLIPPILFFNFLFTFIVGHFYLIPGIVFPFG